MNREQVESDFKDLSNSLVSVRDGISAQIRKQSRNIMFIEKRLKRMKESVVKLRLKRREIDESLAHLSGVRDELSFVGIASGVRQEPLPSSDDQVDSDLIQLSSDSDESQCESKVTYKCLEMSKL